MTQLSASHPLITSKPGVTPPEALGLLGEQPYESLGPKITITLPKLLFKPLDIEQAVKPLAQSSKIYVSQRLLLNYRSHFGTAHKPAGSHTVETDTGWCFPLTRLLHSALQHTFLLARQGQTQTPEKLCPRTA